MLKSIILFLCIGMFCHIIQAQNTDIKLSGQILDKQSQTPIPYVHVIGRNTQTTANVQGVFSLSVHKGDTLNFYHLNFDRSSILISDIPDQMITIYLNKKEHVMDEIIIHEYLPVEELKQKMITHEIKYSKDEINATINVETSTLMYKQGYIPEMNSLDNFKNYIKEPQGVTFFSTNPSKGLFKSIQKISNPKVQLYNKNLNKNRTEKDTTLTHPFLEFMD